MKDFHEGLKLLALLFIGWEHLVQVLFFNATFFIPLVIIGVVLFKRYSSAKPVPYGQFALFSITWPIFVTQAFWDHRRQVRQMTFRQVAVEATKKQ